MTDVGGLVQAIMSTYFLPSLANGPAVAAQCGEDVHYTARNGRTLEDTARLLFCANVGNMHYVRDFIFDWLSGHSSAWSVHHAEVFRA